MLVRTQARWTLRQFGQFRLGWFGLPYAPLLWFCSDKGRGWTVPKTTLVSDTLRTFGPADRLDTSVLGRPFGPVPRQQKGPRPSGPGPCTGYCCCRFRTVPHAIRMHVPQLSRTPRLRARCLISSARAWTSSRSFTGRSEPRPGRPRTRSDPARS